MAPAPSTPRQPPSNRGISVGLGSCLAIGLLVALVGCGLTTYRERLQDYPRADGRVAGGELMLRLVGSWQTGPSQLRRASPYTLHLRVRQGEERAELLRLESLSVVAADGSPVFELTWPETIRFVDERESVRVASLSLTGLEVPEQDIRITLVLSIDDSASQSMTVDMPLDLGEGFRNSLLDGLMGV